MSDAMASFPYQPSVSEQQQCQYGRPGTVSVSTTHRSNVALPTTSHDMQQNAWSSACSYGGGKPVPGVDPSDINRHLAQNAGVPLQFPMHLTKPTSVAIATSHGMIKVPIPQATQMSAFQVQGSVPQQHAFSVERTDPSQATEEHGSHKSSQGKDLPERKVVPNIKIGQMLQKEKALGRPQEKSAAETNARPSGEYKSDSSGEELNKSEEKGAPKLPVAETYSIAHPLESKPKKKKHKWTGSGEMKTGASAGGSHHKKPKKHACDVVAAAAAGLEVFICSSCGKQFAEDKHLKRHQLLHSNERQHKCSLCGMAFIRADHQRRHEKTHTGERPYGCNVCSKAFTRASHLKRHKRLHSGDKPFECDECEKAYIDPSHLKRHKLTHIRLLTD